MSIENEMTTINSFSKQLDNCQSSLAKLWTIWVLLACSRMHTVALRIHWHCLCHISDHTISLTFSVWKFNALHKFPFGCFWVACGAGGINQFQCEYDEQANRAKTHTPWQMPHVVCLSVCVCACYLSPFVIAIKSNHIRCQAFCFASVIQSCRASKRTVFIFQRQFIDIFMRYVAYIIDYLTLIVAQLHA